MTIKFSSSWLQIFCIAMRILRIVSNDSLLHLPIPLSELKRSKMSVEHCSKSLSKYDIGASDVSWIKQAAAWNRRDRASSQTFAAKSDLKKDFLNNSFIHLIFTWTNLNHKLCKLVDSFFKHICEALDIRAFAKWSLKVHFNLRHFSKMIQMSSIKNPDFSSRFLFQHFCEVVS